LRWLLIQKEAVPFLVLEVFLFILLMPLAKVAIDCRFHDDDDNGELKGYLGFQIRYR